MIAFVDHRRGACGIEPHCRGLLIAPFTWRAHTARRTDPSKVPPHVRQYAALRGEIRRLWNENFRAYGVSKEVRIGQPSNQKQPSSCPTNEVHFTTSRNPAIRLCGHHMSSWSDNMHSRLLLMAILVSLVFACPKAQADECFCLVHTGSDAILRGCDNFKAPNDRYATAFCTDPVSGRKSQQTVYSDWQRIKEGADRCDPCRPAQRGAAKEVPRGNDDAADDVRSR